MAFSLRFTVYRRHGKMCWYNFIVSFFENMKKGCTSFLGSTDSGTWEMRGFIDEKKGHDFHPMGNEQE